GWPLHGPAPGRSPSVVPHLDHDPAAALTRLQDDGPDGGLACGTALGLGLDPVVDRVAEQVHHRVLDLFEDLAVDLGVPADLPQLDLLACRPGELARHA